MGHKPIIGLLGGGQLGRMLCEAAGPLGIEVVVLDEENSPAKQVNNHSRHSTGSFKDPDKTRELASHCDILTVEIEHVETQVLEDIEKHGIQVQDADGKVRTKKVAVHPSWRTIRLVQDKYEQKEHFRSHGVPIADQMALESGDATMASLREASQKLGFPFMLKARKGSYDGRGNFRVRSEQDFQPALKTLGNLPLFAEKWAHFEMELAVMVIRTEDSQGQLKRCIAYPAVETVHEDSICTKVYMPPRQVPQDVCEQARRIASEVVATLWGRGVFAVEMFLLKDGTVMVNEVAPRPHNSGHVTIEAIPYMSQYKAQLYSLLDLPIHDELTPRVNSAIMLNILGGAAPDSHDELVNLAETMAEKDMDLYLHLYGKSSKPGRKIGHITTTGPSVSIEQLQTLTEPLAHLVDKIRQERIEAASEQLKPQQVVVQQTGNQGKKALVLVTMGSDSDLPIMKAGLDILEEFQVPYSLNITSAHRTPTYMAEVASEAASRGFKVVISGAGGAAHLPGMFASHTTLPVVGVPVAGKRLGGEDSLYSIVQMPRGVPVATVGIDNSTNAALLAIRILGAFMPEYQDRMAKYQCDMEEGVFKKRNKLQDVGYVEYLKVMGK